MQPAGPLAEGPGIVTVAALIARNQVIGMAHYFNKASDSRVMPRELSEIITHLAFYSGLALGFLDKACGQGGFARRGV